MRCKHGVVERIILVERKQLEKPETEKNKLTIEKNSTQSTSDSSKQSKPILIEDNMPKLKRRRISHDAQFKTEVIDARENGFSTKDKSTKVLTLIKLKFQSGSKMKTRLLRLL